MIRTTDCSSVVYIYMQHSVIAVIVTKCVGTHRQFRLIATNNGLETTYVDATDLSQVEAALRDNTKVQRMPLPLNWVA